MYLQLIPNINIASYNNILIINTVMKTTNIHDNTSNIYPKIGRNKLVLKWTARAKLRPSSPNNEVALSLEHSS